MSTDTPSLAVINRAKWLVRALQCSGDISLHTAISARQTIRRAADVATGEQLADLIGYLQTPDPTNLGATAGKLVVVVHDCHIIIQGTDEQRWTAGYREHCAETVER